MFQTGFRACRSDMIVYCISVETVHNCHIEHKRCALGKVYDYWFYFSELDGMVNIK